MRFVSFAFIILFAVVTISSAQTGGQGAFIAAAMKNGTMIGQNSIMAGGRAGWIVGGKYSFSAAFYSLANKVETVETDPLSGRKLLTGFNCGGLELEYIYAAEDFLHGSVLFFMGGGGLKPKAADLSIPHSSYYGQSILVWEPQVNAEINLTRLLHLGVGLSYMFVTGMDGYIGLQNKDLSGLNSIVTLRFGTY